MNTIRTAICSITASTFLAGSTLALAQDQSAARVSALWQPSDSFKWNLSYEYFLDRGTPDLSLMQNPRPGQDFCQELGLRRQTLRPQTGGTSGFHQRGKIHVRGQVLLARLV